jgi:hypothetical protein
MPVFETKRTSMRNLITTACLPILQGYKTPESINIFLTFSMKPTGVLNDGDLTGLK